jgi:TetR/AcrR family transcriptional repressor of uid operon
MATVKKARAAFDARPAAKRTAAGRRGKAAARGVAAAVAPLAPDHADLRRQQILDAAEECFRRYGFHNATMVEIAKSFGMSAGHIYNYFDSKEAIIAGIVERDLDEFMQRAALLQRASDMQSALLERVDEGVADKLNACKAARQFEVLAEAGRNPEVLAMVQATDARVRDVLRDIFRRTHADGHSGRDLDGKITVLMALFDGLMIRGLRQPDAPRAQVTRVLRALLREMMR